MKYLDREVPRRTHVLSRVHTYAGLAMLYWWELKHLYVYLFQGK